MAGRPALSPALSPALEPASITLDADGVPHAPAFGDRYHPRHGATVQAQQVFLAGNGLPARWAGRARFTILETGFGLGQNFLAAWHAWQADPARPARLHYVGIEGHPARADDLARCLAGSPFPALAAALCAAWPPPLAGLHSIDLDGGRVQLLLAHGDVAAVLRQLDVEADAFFLDGFAPDRNPAMWTPALMQALARRAAPGATAATWTVARAVRDGLQAAGFVFERAPGPGEKRETLRARHAPAFTPRRAPSRLRAPGRALVVGAGIAGAWAAHALRAQGWQATVLDRHAAPAMEASGNAGGLVHGTVMADDGSHARWNRAAALAAEREIRPWIEGAGVPGGLHGLLRLAATGEPAAALRELAGRQGLPASYVQVLDAAEASARAGCTLDRPAWLYPGGGWVAPTALVHALLQDMPFRGGAAVDRIVRDGDQWQAMDAAGRTIDAAEVLVLANAAEAARLWPQAGWPLGRSRGQISQWPVPPADAPRPALPLAGGGYLLALPDGSLLCGATAQPGDGDPALREADHRFNLARLHAMTGWEAPLPTAGRVGWRALAPDRLPLVGAVPAEGGQTPLRLRDVAREPGLYVLSGLGSRGLTWGPLAGRLLAAWVAGSPMPVEASLRDALDPARWRVRAARRAAR